MKQFVVIMLLALCLFAGCNSQAARSAAPAQQPDASAAAGISSQSETPAKGAEYDVDDLFGSWRLVTYTDDRGTFTAEDWGRYLYAELSFYSTGTAEYKIDDWYGYEDIENSLEVKRIEGALLPAWSSCENQAWYVDLRSGRTASTMNAAVYGDKLYFMYKLNPDNKYFPHAFFGVYQWLDIDRQLDKHEWEEWMGEYTFSEAETSNQKTEYHISVYKNNDLLEAYMEIDGLEAMARKRVQVVGNTNYVELVFAEFVGDDSFPASLYRYGDVMLTLYKKNSELYTAWGKLQPMLIGNTAMENAAPGIYFHKAGPSLSNPDFLDSDKRAVYEKAMKIYEEYFATGFGGRTVLQDSITINDMMYQRMGGEYSRWDDFIADLRSVFTEEWVSKVETGRAYVSSNGYTYFLGADRGGNIFYIGPDLYALVSENEDQVRFQIIGQYDYEDGKGIVQKAFPVELVKTAAGWRVSEISVTY